jgi:hypothetical protein
MIGCWLCCYIRVCSYVQGLPSSCAFLESICQGFVYSLHQGVCCNRNLLVCLFCLVWFYEHGRLRLEETILSRSVPPALVLCSNSQRYGLVIFV